MYCLFCGKYNPPEARFCYSCGKPFEQRAEQSSSTGSQALPQQSAALPTYVPPAVLPVQQNVLTANQYPAPYLGVPAQGFNSVPISSPSAPYNNSGMYSYKPYPGYFNPQTNPVDTSNAFRYHPFLQGAVGLPFDFYLKPTTYYSYVTPQNRVIIVKRGSFWQRMGAITLDFLILLIPNIILLTLYTSSLDFNINRSNSSRVEGPQWWWYLILYLINFGYFWIGTTRGGTLGKRASHLRIIRLDGKNPDGFTAFLRQCCGFLLSASPGLLAFIVLSLISLILLPSSAIGNSAAARTNSVYLAFVALIFIPLVFIGSSFGFIWAVWDSKKQAWHDKLARTLVVEDVIWVEGQNFGLPPR